MAEQIFTHDLSSNHPRVLARKMSFEALKSMFWGKMGKFNTPGARPANKGNLPKPISAPIVMQYELQKSAGDSIEIPMHRNLKNLPKTGDQQLQGHEETPKVNHAHIPIELLRHAERPQDGTMGTQRNKFLRLIQNARPALLRHYARALEYLQFSYAFYYGFSWNILNSGSYTNDTRLIQATSHPHVYTSGAGKVGYGSGYPGTSSYETAIGTAMTAMGSGDVFDMNFLSGLKADAQIQKIMPLHTKDGNAYRILVAHPWQINTLEADPSFNSLASSVWVQNQAKDNPYIVGAKYYVHGFAIFSSDTAVWPCRVNSGDPEYGPASITDLNVFEDYSGNTLFAGIVLGDNAMFRAIGSALEFIPDAIDYRQRKGVAYQVHEGCGRADYWNRDDGSRGQYVNNDGSAIFITYASAPGF